MALNGYYEIETAPSPISPVTLTDAKLWCRVDTSADDTLLQRLINTATTDCEKRTNRVFIERTIKGYFDRLYKSGYESFNYITLTKAPLIDVSSITVESGGSSVAFSDFVVKKTAGFSRVLFTEAIPSVDDVAYPITVTFTAGYGAESAVPDDIKQMILSYVLFLYENRGDVEAVGKLRIPRETINLIKRYRIVYTYG